MTGNASSSGSGLTPEERSRQFELLSEWQQDKNDLNHPRPAQWFAKTDWDRGLLQEAFIETLKVLIEDYYAPVRRQCRHLSKAPWSMQLPFDLLRNSTTTKEKRNWERIWYTQHEIDDWSKDQIIEHYILLKDEDHHFRHIFEKFDNYEKFLETEKAAGRIHSGRPQGFIPKRRGEV